jgi:phospholipase/carboxylesterase
VKRIDTTLEHRFLMPKRTNSATHPTVLMLHGRGSDEEDLLGLAEYFDNRFLLIGARAPFTFAGGGYTWYDVKQYGEPDLDSFLASYGRLSHFLDDILAGYPVDPKTVLLFGFSMGTVMAYTLALTQPARIRGVAANSGYLPEIPSLQYHWQKLDHTEFFISHGTEDPVIPVILARRARALLESSNASVLYHEYPMPHAIGAQALADVVAWTSRFLP